jgi:hypothetical protein
MTTPNLSPEFYILGGGVGLLFLKEALGFVRWVLDPKKGTGSNGKGKGSDAEITLKILTHTESTKRQVNDLHYDVQGLKRETAAISTRQEKINGDFEKMAEAFNGMSTETIKTRASCQSRFEAIERILDRGNGSR